MSPDFLQNLEDALWHLQGLDATDRMQCDPDGENGILQITMEDGSKYSLHFNRQ